MTVQTFSVPVEPIPATHQVGDPNHTPDHNSIVQVLTDYDNYIGQLQSQIASMFSVAGGNVCNITGTSTPLATVNLPAGNRDSAVDTLDVMCAGVKVFSLNGYGELRIFPQLASHIAQVIKAQPSQTGDLLQPGTQNAETWHNFNPLSSSWFLPGGGYAKYRLTVANELQISAAIATPSSGNVNNQVIATFPTGYRPASTHYLVTSGDNVQNSVGGVNPQVYINSSGQLQSRGCNNSCNVWIDGRIPLDI